MKSYYFRINLKEEAEQFFAKNPEFVADKKELLEDYGEDDKIFRMQMNGRVELNPTDECVELIRNGVVFGTVTEDAADLADLIADENFSGAWVRLSGGRFIQFVEDEIHGGLKLQRGEEPYSALLKVEMKEPKTEPEPEPQKKAGKGMAALFLILGIILIVLGALLCIVSWPVGVIGILIGVFCLIYRKKLKP